MSDANKQRPVIDLDELERQLRAAAGRARTGATCAFRLRTIRSRNWPASSARTTPTSPLAAGAAAREAASRHVRSDFDALLAEQRSAADERYAGQPTPTVDAERDRTWPAA